MRFSSYKWLIVSSLSNSPLSSSSSEMVLPWLSHSSLLSVFYYLYILLNLFSSWICIYLPLEVKQPTINKTFSDFLLWLCFHVYHIMLQSAWIVSVIAEITSTLINHILLHINTASIRIGLLFLWFCTRYSS